MNHTTISDIYLMENLMNSHKIASISNSAPTKNRAKEYEFMVWIIIFGMNSYTRV
jgi:hypothetical protein